MDKAVPRTGQQYRQREVFGAGATPEVAELRDTRMPMGHPLCSYATPPLDVFTNFVSYNCTTGPKVSVIDLDNKAARVHAHSLAGIDFWEAVIVYELFEYARRPPRSPPQRVTAGISNFRDDFGITRG